MRLAEERNLPVLNDESDYLVHVGGWNIACTVTRSMRADCIKSHRVHPEPKSLTLVDSPGNRIK